MLLLYTFYALLQKQIKKLVMVLQSHWHENIRGRKECTHDKGVTREGFPTVTMFTLCSPCHWFILRKEKKMTFFWWKSTTTHTCFTHLIICCFAKGESLREPYTMQLSPLWRKTICLHHLHGCSSQKTKALSGRGHLSNWHTMTVGLSIFNQ